MDIMLFILKGIMIVSLIFLGLCALAAFLLIAGAVALAIKTRRREQKGGRDVLRLRNEDEGLQSDGAADGWSGGASGDGEGGEVSFPLGVQTEADGYRAGRL